MCADLLASLDAELGGEVAELGGEDYDDPLVNFLRRAGGGGRGRASGGRGHRPRRQSQQLGARGRGRGYAHTDAARARMRAGHAKRKANCLTQYATTLTSDAGRYERIWDNIFLGNSKSGQKKVRVASGSGATVKITLNQKHSQSRDKIRAACSLVECSASGLAQFVDGSQFLNCSNIFDDVSMGMANPFYCGTTDRGTAASEGM